MLLHINFSFICYYSIEFVGPWDTPVRNGVLWKPRDEAIGFAFVLGPSISFLELFFENWDAWDVPEKQDYDQRRVESYPAIVNWESDDKKSKGE